VKNWDFGISMNGDFSLFASQSIVWAKLNLCFVVLRAIGLDAAAYHL